MGKEPPLPYQKTRPPQYKGGVPEPRRPSVSFTDDHRSQPNSYSDLESISKTGPAHNPNREANCPDNVLNKQRYRFHVTTSGATGSGTESNSFRMSVLHGH